uniref:Splicing factor U2AF 35 kDa subunit n=1 Tax=Apteryx owenii TaxID=8824 RepID=A0A8B9Q7M5_APTOW
MAEYLASIFGTEKDKVNCSFYFKIGACRHGDRCSRLHNKPTFSQTIALLNIYRNPQNSSQSADGLRCAVSDVEMQEHYDEFFEEVFTEMEEKYGEVEEMNVCDNLGDHLVGNVYVKFRREEDAEKAVIDLNNRWFNGQPIHAELSPVTDFREACCRQYEMGECTRGGFCNFMHLKPISRELRRELYGRRRKKLRDYSEVLLHASSLLILVCTYLLLVSGRSRILGLLGILSESGRSLLALSTISCIYRYIPEAT